MKVTYAQDWARHPFCLKMSFFPLTAENVGFSIIRDEIASKSP